MDRTRPLEVSVLAPVQAGATRGRSLAAVLRSVVGLNVQYLRAHPDTPRLYQSGVRYRAEPGAGSGREEFAVVPVVLSRGWGDCDDLAAWRAAELRVRGEDARAVIRRAPEGWHCLVVRANGTIEDPSRVLGMGL